MAKLFQELMRRRFFDIKVKFISMDPGFNQINLSLLKENTEKLGIPIILRNSNIFKVAEKIAKDYPCYICARMRRGFLYNVAQELGCNKLALGHHFDDIIETTMMNIFYSGMVRTMLPKIKSDNFENMELIRPMCLIREKDIERIMKKNNIETMDCGCEIHACSISSKRQRVKRLIKELSIETKDVKKNIFRSVENIDKNGIIGWIDKKERFNRYD